MGVQFFCGKKRLFKMTILPVYLISPKVQNEKETLHVHAALPFCLIILDLNFRVIVALPFELGVS